MSQIQFKKETLKLLDIMIQHAEEGPSGFWVEDHEGCGNPKIFRDFAEGLKSGRLIQKQHYICPWNTAVLYGEGHGNIHTGCYYSCSLQDARCLPPEMLKAVLYRFRKRLSSGKYDCLEYLSPLLTKQEQVFIQKKKTAEKESQKYTDKEQKADKAKEAKELILKYRGNENVQSLIKNYYGEPIAVNTEGGIIDFSPEGMKDIVSSKAISYDEYLELQIESRGKYRRWLAMCYYNFPAEFKGQIEVISNGKICFRRIYVTGMYSDGCSFFDGKEDHIWMDADAFADLNAGECVSFYAEVYRYVKTGHGKTLNYGLRNPQNIKKIDKYQLPSDTHIAMQQVNEIICETCYLSEQCDRQSCIRNPKEMKKL